MLKVYRRRRYLREDSGTMANGQRRGRKRRKRGRVSEKSSTARAARGGKEPGPTGRKRGRVSEKSSTARAARGGEEPGRRGRKRGRVSEKSSTARAARGGEEPGPTGRTEVDSCCETRTELVQFDDHQAFTLEDLAAASTVVLGEGTYGAVRLATLEDGKQVAVRRPSWASIKREFEAEVNKLGRVRHPNLLALRAYHFSLEGEKNYLVFDYMSKGNLSSFLDGRLRFVRWISDCNHPARQRKLREDPGPYNCIDWHTRKNITIGIARGLHYLHTQENMVHGNLTSRNILLDDHTNAKIADYGLSHLMIPVANFSVTDTTGALGYHAPELSKLKEPNFKTDVYSLGVIMLELLTGKSPRETINSLHLPEWVAWTMMEQGADKVFDPDLIVNASGTMRNELLDTLTLALRCVDPSPYARPEVLQVLQQFEGIKPKIAGDIDATTTKGGDKPVVRCADVVGTMTTAAPTTDIVNSSSSSMDMLEEGTGCPAQDSRVGNSENLTDDENLQAQTLPPENQHKDKVGELAKLTSRGDLKDGDQAQTSTPAEDIIQDRSGNEDSFVSSSTDRPEGNNGASFPIFDMDEALVEGKINQHVGTEGTDAASEDTLASQLSSIDWEDIPIEAHLEVPTSPPLMNSSPDSGYQRYFQTLYDLAYRSPPLSSDVLKVQLNRMIVGIHSLGYPLDTWLKAAALVLGLAQKREYIEQHVDEYFKVHVETQLTEFASAVDPIKEKISSTRSDITTLEEKEKELGETITELEDQLAVLRTQREGVVDSLSASRDQLAAEEAKMQSVLVDMERLNQQYSAILDLRSELLGEVPSLDEAFDTSFWEILTKKF